MMIMLMYLAGVAVPIPTPTLVEDRAMLDAVAAALDDSLKDAPSARFQRVYLRYTTGTDGKVHHGVCGQINSKNSYGAYGGWETFWGGQLAGEVKVYVGKGQFLSADDMCAPDRGTWDRRVDYAEALHQRISHPSN